VITIGSKSTTTPEQSRQQSSIHRVRPGPLLINPILLLNLILLLILLILILILIYLVILLVILFKRTRVEPLPPQHYVGHIYELL